MAKQLNVSLNFTANTEQAKAAIQELQTNLSKISINALTSTNRFGLSKELADSVTHANKLSTILSSSLKLDGTLDIGKFNQNLKASGQSLSDYAQHLIKLGPEGASTFAQLAQSITMASVPLKQTNNLLKEFGTTLANTARWQISSSILHGFMGAVQGAYGYAQDLNESLNNIRIVTGQNVDQMARFAEQANKAAKALSTTTTDYTNASLIYYQQGLSDEEVKERTDVTVKMANAAGVSAQTVSDQMTAVWNNFDDGSKSLEYYADVMTALGAATASSTDEIAAGLEKFAAVSETVGLSYEYATAALATVTATTRQSADVVGNAFKTLFARIQGLNLGETLDDGTTLNKYSQALEKVGISIFEQNGEMKDMNNILDEMGAKWDTLDKAQQTALAQTVAGVRQYTQLVALMDNWDYFKENLGVAMGSEGELQKQANIYAESWEASAKRVQAAAQGVYQSLIDEDFFIDMNNSLEKTLSFVDNLISSFGGLRGVLAALATIMLNTFSSNISSSLETMYYNIKLSTEGGRNQIKKLREEANHALANLSRNDNTPQGQAQGDIYEKQANFQNQILSKSEQLLGINKSLTAEEEKQAQKMLEQLNIAGQSYIKQVETLSILEKQNLAQQTKISLSLNDDDKEGLKQLHNQEKLLGFLIQFDAELEQIGEQDFSSNPMKQFQKLREKVQELLTLTGNDAFGFENIFNDLFAATDQGKFDQALKALHAAMGELGTKAQITANHLKEVLEPKYGKNKAQSIIDEIQNSFSAEGEMTAETIEKLEKYNLTVDRFGRIVENFKGKTVSMADGITALSQSLMALNTVISSIQGLSNIWSDEDLTLGQKILQSVTTLSMTLPMLTTALSKNNIEKLKGLAVGKQQLMQEIATLFNIELSTEAIEDHTEAEVQDAVVEAASTVVSQNQNRANVQETITTKALTKAIWEKIWAKRAAIATYTILTLAVMAVVWAISAHQKKLKENMEQAQENADKQKELAKAQQETVESNEDLIKSYEELLSTYKDVEQEFNDGSSTVEDLAEAQNNLAESAIETAKALGIEGAALASLSGNYDQLTKDIREAQKKEIQQAKKQEKKAQSAISSEFSATLYAAKNTVGSRGNERYYLNGIGASTIKNKLNDTELDYLEFGGRNNMFLKFDYNNADQVIEAYEEVQSVVDQLSDSLTNEEQQSNEAFKSLNAYLSEYKEIYDSYIESQELIEKYDIQDRALFYNDAEDEYGGDSEKEKSIYDISSLKEYQEKRNQIINAVAARQGINPQDNVEEWNDLTKAVDAYLNTVQSVSEYAQADAALDEMAKKVSANGKSVEEAKDLVQLMYETIPEEKRELLFKINPYSDPKTWDDQFAYLQDLADAETIKLRVEIIAAGKDLIGSTNTEEWLNWSKTMDWKALGEYLGVSDYGIDDFLKLSDEAQKNLLTEYDKATDIAYGQELANAANAAPELIAGVQAQLDNRQQGYDSAVGMVGMIEDYKWQSQTDNFDFAEWSKKYSNKFDNFAADEANFTEENMKAELDAANIKIQQYESLLSEKQGYETQMSDYKQYQSIQESIGWRENAAEEIEAMDLDYDEVKKYSQTIDEMVEISDELDERLDDNDQSLLNFAKSAKQTERGIKKLNSGLKDWKKALSSKDTKQQAQAWLELEDALADVMNVSDELSESGMSLGNHFKNYVLENMELVEKAAQGDKDAIFELQKVAAEDIVMGLELDEETTNAALENLRGIQDYMQSALDSQQLKIGTPIMETGPLLESLNSMINAMGLSVSQAQSLLAGLGFDATVIPVEAPEKTVNRTFQYPIFGTDRYGYPVYNGIRTVTTQDTIEGGEIGSALEIVSGEYVGGGNVGGVSSGSSGGGGGGSKKSPEKKSDIEKTRYHTVTNQLEDLKSEYDDIAEASDRAFGADKLKAMDEEIAKTDELIDKQEEYIDAISENLPKDKAIMEAYYKEIIGGPAMQFDEKGNISNYDEIQDAMYKAWNEDKYGLPEEEREAWEERYEKLEKYIEQYEETYDLLRDEETALQELINQRLDAELEKVQYEVELKLNVSDDSLAVIEFQLDMLGDNAYRAAEAIEYQTEQAEILYDKMQANEQGLKDILATSDMSVQEIQQLLEGDTSVLNGHTFTEAQMEAIREYRDNLLDLSEELQEVRDEVQQRLLDAFDEWNEELDEGIEKFDHYNTLMENFKNIIDIVGQDYLKVDNAMMGSLNQANVDNRINKVTATKDALEALLKTEAEAMEQYNAAIERGNQNDIDYWRETLDVIGEEVTSAQEEMMTAWEEALQAAAEAFEQAVELAIDNFEKALLPFGTLDEFSDAYDKQKEVADQYLDDYQQIYELSKLNRDINNSIDDTKSIAGKQKLKGLLDDINELQEEGTQLSEYDLDYLQKTYDLRLAEIALEEAQKAKNTVRLTRDNEGNFSYAYTINDDAADDAAQKYEDALYAMQETSSEYIDEMSEQLISTSKEMEEALAAVRVEDYASIEEYYQKLDEIQQYYLDRMTYMQGEMQKALDNNKALYEQDWQNYSAATGYKISDDENFAMSYKDTVLGTLFGSESDIVDFQERVNEALGDSDSGLIGELLAAYIAWSQNTDRAMVEAGTSSEEFAEDMDEAVYGDGGIMDSSNAATEAVDNMANQMVAGFDTISSAIERWQTQAGDAADSVIKEYLDVVKAYNLMVDTLSTPAGSQNAEAELSDIAYSGDDNIYIDPSVGRFATGGYTGVWDSRPKWALLDQKELVLNENDTSNFLSAIKLTRSMLETIDLNAQQQAIGGANWLNASMLRNDLTQSLEQQVHITAEFPSITDHYEVEEALNNLINTSSQYANRK